MRMMIAASAMALVVGCGVVQAAPEACHRFVDRDFTLTDMRGNELGGMLTQVDGAYKVTLDDTAIFCLQGQGVPHGSIKTVVLVGSPVITKRIRGMIGHVVFFSLKRLRVADPMIADVSVININEEPDQEAQEQKAMADVANVKCSTFTDAQGSKLGDSWWTAAAGLVRPDNFELASACNKAEAVKIMCKRSPDQTVGDAITALAKMSNREYPRSSAERSR